MTPDSAAEGRRSHPVKKLGCAVIVTIFACVSRRDGCCRRADDRRWQHALAAAKKMLICFVETPRSCVQQNQPNAAVW